ncbi:MAG: type II secretion system protein, partial [Aphanizomenon sp.]
SASMAAPTSETKKDLYCVQSDGTILPPDCSSNQNNLFYIQARRTRINGSDPKDGYRLAVRVYRQDIEFDNPDRPVLVNTNTTKNTQAVVGSGNKQAPLVEIIADIANNNTSFTDLCNRLGFRAGSATIPCS